MRDQSIRALVGEAVVRGGKLWEGGGQGVLPL